jgi:hypothetical protein
MVDVADKELCEELLEISGIGANPIKAPAEMWAYCIVRKDFNLDPEWGWGVVHKETKQKIKMATVPAYDLGFLMRQFPERKVVQGVFYRNEKWHCEFMGKDFALHSAYDETMENAVCKLLIKLYQGGILINNSDGGGA